MSDLQTLNNLIEEVGSMKDQNYSLIPSILNDEETIKSLKRVRDFLVTSKLPE